MGWCRRQPPRRPPLADVLCGLTLGAGLGAVTFEFAASGAPFFATVLREKSGMAPCPCFDMIAPGRLRFSAGDAQLCDERVQRRNIVHDGNVGQPRSTTNQQSYQS